MPLRRTPPTTSENSGKSLELPPQPMDSSSAPATDTENEGTSRLVSRRRKRPIDDDLAAFMSDIKQSFEKFKTEQNCKLESVQKSLNEIKSQNSDIIKSIEFLSEQHEEFKNTIETLKNQATSDRNYVILLENKVEDLLMDSRKSNIEIKNVPHLKGESKEDLIGMVNALSKTVSCPVEKKDISDIYRIKSNKKTGNNTPIIVEMSSTILKSELQKSCKIFNIKQKTKLSAKHLGIRTNEDTPIYVSEHLTPKNSRLFFLSRDLVKSKKYKYCWTAYGKVYVRKLDETPVIKIHSEEQIQKLIQEI